MDTIYYHGCNAYCIAAPSFPHGIKKAHEELKRALPEAKTRKFFGVSRPEGQVILYKACAEVFPHEVGSPSLETEVISSGIFILQRISDWESNEDSIPMVFEQLIRHPETDPEGYCLEEYDGPGLNCMVPLKKELVLTRDRNELRSGLENAFHEFIWLIKDTDQEEINLKIENSWTIGQVADHIVKATEGLPDKNTIPEDRLYSEKEHLLRDVFLNFETKLTSPRFIIPGDGPFEKATLLTQLESNRESLDAAIEKDLHELCADLELPVFGMMTRYEWLKLNQYHIQRHVNQMIRLKSLIRKETERVSKH